MMKMTCRKMNTTRRRWHDYEGDSIWGYKYVVEWRAPLAALHKAGIFRFLLGDVRYPARLALRCLE